MSRARHFTVPISRLILFLGGWCLFLSGCGGGSNSSSGPAETQSRQQDVFVYLRAEQEGSPAKLYKVDRQGKPTLLSNFSDDTSVHNFLVSPDMKRVAYWDWGVDGRKTLAIRPVDTADATRTRLVLDHDQYLDWGVNWLPDSLHLLLTMRDPDYNYWQSLSLVTVGGGDPVELISAVPGTSILLDYRVSGNGDRAAALIGYWDEPYLSPMISASLYLLDLRSAGEPQLLDTTEGEANAFDFSWSPTGGALLYQQTRDDTNGRVPRGPVILRSEDGVTTQLLEGITDRSARWLSSERILTASSLMFEVIETDGSVIASHTSTIRLEGIETGAASLAMSPNGRWLGFLDWTDVDCLEVYLYDIASGETRVIGPASSTPDYVRGFVAGYNESELHWSKDSTWLVWDQNSLIMPYHRLYAYAVETGARESIETGATYFVTPGFPQRIREDYPWLPQQNLLEYLVTDGYSVEEGSILTVLDVDAKEPWFIAPSSKGPAEVVDAGTGKTIVVEPAGICERVWLGNDELLWHGCDDNAYLSRIADRALVETRLLATGVVPQFFLTLNHEIAMFYPANYNGSFWMYDLVAQRQVELPSNEVLYCCDHSGLLQ